LLDRFDVILCADLAYDRSSAARERQVMEAAARRGATVLLANAERTYFDEHGLELILETRVPVVRDLEGVDMRLARVYRIGQ
jgi:predicted nicotinamide N-methyase